MTRQAQKNYLLFTALVIGCFAPIYLLGAAVSTAEVTRWSMDLFDWPLDGQTTWAAKETRFLSALAGGFLLGWAVLVWCLRTWVYDLAPDGVRRSVVVSGVAWYLLDSAGSVLAGVPENAITNVVILALAVGPLWWPAKEDVVPVSGA